MQISTSRASYRTVCTGECFRSSLYIVGRVQGVRVASVHTVIAGSGQEMKTHSHKLHVQHIIGVETTGAPGAGAPLVFQVTSNSSPYHSTL